MTLLVFSPGYIPHVPNKTIPPPGKTSTFPVWHCLCSHRVISPLPLETIPPSGKTSSCPVWPCLSLNRLYLPCSPNNYPSSRGNFDVPPCLLTGYPPRPCYNHLSSRGNLGLSSMALLVFQQVISPMPPPPLQLSLPQGELPLAQSIYHSHFVSWIRFGRSLGLG